MFVQSCVMYELCVHNRSFVQKNSITVSCGSRWKLTSPTSTMCSGGNLQMPREILWVRLVLFAKKCLTYILFVEEPPFANDLIYGVVGYSTKEDMILDYSKFGSITEDISDDLKKRLQVSTKKEMYNGRLIAAPDGEEMGSLSMYVRIWGMLTKIGDVCGDLLTASGAGAIAALLMRRGVLAVDPEGKKVYFFMRAFIM